MTTITEQAETILQTRYLLKDEEGELKENTDQLFRRVAKALAQVEEQYMTLPVEAELLEKDFYEMLSNFYFLPNSPTLMNAGTEAGTLSGCFVLPLEDSMEGIMKAASDTAMVQKFGGGTGFSLSKIRPKGARINTTHGKACGPIEVLKTLSRVSSMITQGGKRDGANMAVMSVYHPDIKEFITCKRQEGDIHNFNISVAVDNMFMEQLSKGASYQLIDPATDQVVGWQSSEEIFDMIIDGAWNNGEPGLIFLDTINLDNRIKGKYGDMIATNPCGEQPLLSNESCNLGSINLAKFFLSNIESSLWEAKFDWVKLKRITELAIRFLDNTIDANKYATKDIEKMTKSTRKIGLGVMGFADLLIELQISYVSDDAKDVAEKIMRYVRDIADKTSLELGVTRGYFPAWHESDYSLQNPYRNACRLSIAPTGTISMIADTSSGIEPTFSLAWQKSNVLEGHSFFFVNKFFEADAQKAGFHSEQLMADLAGGVSLQQREEVPQWVKDVYITAADISPREHVEMQSIFQQFVDAGISKTINFPFSATKEDVREAYVQAWELNCKGITVYRNGSRVKEVLTNGHTPIETSSECGCDQPLIVNQEGCKKCLNCMWSACEV